MLIKGNTTYEKKSKENYGLEFHEPYEFDNLPSPRVFNSHIGYRHLPRDLVDIRCKIIFVQRNPKYVAVSFYNHTKKLDPLFFDGSWDNYLKLFLNEKGKSLCFQLFFSIQIFYILRQHNNTVSKGIFQSIISLLKIISHIMIVFN